MQIESIKKYVITLSTAEYNKVLPDYKSNKEITFDNSNSDLEYLKPVFERLKSLVTHDDWQGSNLDNIYEKLSEGEVDNVVIKKA